MTSMTKLRRRLTRWQRYDRRYRSLSLSFTDRYDLKLTSGYWHAHKALHVEQDRRRAVAEQRFELADMGCGDIGWNPDDDWCWNCGDDECDGDCEGLPPYRPIIDERAFARLGIL